MSNRMEIRAKHRLRARQGASPAEDLPSAAPSASSSAAPTVGGFFQDPSRIASIIIPILLVICIGATFVYLQQKRNKKRQMELRQMDKRYGQAEDSGADLDPTLVPSTEIKRMSLPAMPAAMHHSHSASTLSSFPSNASIQSEYTINAPQPLYMNHNMSSSTTSLAQMASNPYAAAGLDSPFGKSSFHSRMDSTSSSIVSGKSARSDDNDSVLNQSPTKPTTRSIREFGQPLTGPDLDSVQRPRGDRAPPQRYQSRKLANSGGMTQLSGTAVLDDPLSSSDWVSLAMVELTR